MLLLDMADNGLLDAQEMSQTTRPLIQHRSSLSSTATSGLVNRHTHSRTNSHSVLSSSLNGNNRVTRRKSVTNNSTNVAAVAAALKDAAAEGATAVPIAVGSRRNTVSKGAAARTAVMDSLLSPPSSLPTSKFHLERAGMHESAIDDDPQEVSADEGANGSTQKSRVRRASDGTPLTKERRKSTRPEIRCETCGKGYKHSSCLTKHLFVLLSPSSLPARHMYLRWSNPKRTLSKVESRTIGGVIQLLTFGQVGTHS